MNQLPNVVIVMGHCSRSQDSFGIRFEEQARGVWVIDWAFPVREALAKKEGYDRSEIKGDFVFHNEYPGCPYCKAGSLIFCERCAKVSCHNERNRTAKCGWCGVSSQVGTGDIGGLIAGGDI